MARWKPAATASGLCVCDVAWIDINASGPVSGCRTTRGAAEVMWDLGADRRPSEIKAHPRWVRLACRRHQRDRSRPWRTPNPGEIDEELNGGGSWSTSRPSTSRRRGGLFREGRLPPRRAIASPSSSTRPSRLLLLGVRPAASSTPRPTRPRPSPHSPRVPGSRDGSPRPLYSTLEPRSRPGRRHRPWPRAR